MAQDDILKYLIRKRGQLVSLPELAVVLKINRTNISRAVRKLHENREIRIVHSRQGPFVRFLITIN